MRARLAGILLALVALLAVATPALAAPDQSSGQEITRYDVTAAVASDGVVTVDLDFDFDFGDTPGHGPYLTFPTRVFYDDEHDRSFEYSDVTASSSTGAPAQVNKETTDTALILRIGDPDVDDVSGVQTYHVQLTVNGWLNPANSLHSGDELYWNVIGAGWTIPIGDVTVQVTGPAAVQARSASPDRTGRRTRAPRPFPRATAPRSRRTWCPSATSSPPSPAGRGGRSPGWSPSSSASPTRWRPCSPSRRWASSRSSFSWSGRSSRSDACAGRGVTSRTSA
ncbi:DUF2207 domain-containing protein [Cellulomonas sp. URHE0023]|uniref:DUF2207 domain-containing protein n=1 Tax=Cellulomonas sp. URHE0023 TaxID=1380354 RepID=UPI00047F1E04